MKTMLFVSMIIAISIAGVSYLFFYLKVKKLKNEVKKNDLDEGRIKVFENDSKGVILYDEKSKATNPLSDELMIYLVDTFVRNGYKAISFVGFKSKYEEVSIVQNAKAEINDSNYDMLIIDCTENVIEHIRNGIENLNSKGIVFVVNMKEHKHLISNIEDELLSKKYRHELQKWAKWFFIIAKD